MGSTRIHLAVDLAFGREIRPSIKRIERAPHIRLDAGEQVLEATSTGLGHGRERVDREKELAGLVLVDVEHEDWDRLVAGDVGAEMPVDFLS